MRADALPAATEHIGEIIALIETLEEKGLRLRRPAGDVYFRVRAFPRLRQALEAQRRRAA